MTKRIAILFSIALLLVGGAIITTAQSGPVGAGGPQRQPGGPPPPPPPPFGLPRLDRLAHDLNLTEAQQAELKAFFDTERSTLDSLMKKQDGVRRQLDEATANGQFDEAQVRALAGQQAQTFADLIVEHKRADAKIYSILTPEQRVRFEQLRRRRGQPPPPPPPPPGQPNGPGAPEPPQE
jgi:periplasmic protein CpxP/Spy